jgi:hypothetical protein
VEATSLIGNHRGYVVLVNHSPVPYSPTVSTSLPVHSISRVTTEGWKPLALNGSSWKIDVPPYDGVIVEWK